MLQPLKQLRKLVWVENCQGRTITLPWPEMPVNLEELELTPGVHLSAQMSYYLLEFCVRLTHAGIILVKFVKRELCRIPWNGDDRMHEYARCAGSGVNWEVLLPMHSLRRLTVRQDAQGCSELQDILTLMPRLHTVIYYGACIGEGYHRGTEIRYREHVWARRRILANGSARICRNLILIFVYYMILYYFDLFKYPFKSGGRRAEE